jgi:imidazolonepropionase-like amidohydrolase
VLEAADRGVKVPQYAIDKSKMVMDAHRDSISRAIAAGVKVAMGTDSGVTPHGQNLRELEEMVGCGMSPARALISTTRVAAELLGVDDDRGVIEAGKRADVRSPAAMRSTSALAQRIRTVIKTAKWSSRTADADQRRGQARGSTSTTLRP